MRVRFTAPFDWDVPDFNGRVTIHRPSGWVGTVKRDHGEAAIRAGKATDISAVPLNKGTATTIFGEADEVLKHQVGF